MNDYDTSYLYEDHEALPHQVCPECAAQLYVERTVQFSAFFEDEITILYCLACGYED
jgi:Zn ribbon nucleic-acid-binding protein